MLRIQMPDIGRAANDASNVLLKRQAIADRHANQINARNALARKQAVEDATQRFAAGDEQAGNKLIGMDPARFNSVLDAQAKKRKVSREVIENRALDGARVAAAAARNPAAYDKLRTEYVARYGKDAADDLPPDVTHPEFVDWAKSAITMAQGIAELSKLAGPGKTTIGEVGGTSAGSRQRAAITVDPLSGEVSHAPIGPQMTPTPSYTAIETGAEGVPGGRQTNILNARTGSFVPAGPVKTPKPTKGKGGSGSGGASVKAADENAMARYVAGLFDHMTDPVTQEMRLLNENDRPVVQAIATRASRLFADSNGAKTRNEAVAEAAAEFGIAIPAPSGPAAPPDPADPANIRRFVTGGR